ncbi:MAG: tetratricopeptide repeat protein, partial [Gemmatimonadaceae bacterium]
KAIEKTRKVNVEAYDYYLRGRQHIHQLSRKSLETARKMFRRAIEIDPEYALAHAGLADCSSILYMKVDARESNLIQGDAASQKALDLDPDLAEAHVARGLAVSLRKQFDEAEREFETAMRLDPKLFEAAYYFGRARMSQGRYAEAAKLFERACILRPEDYQAPGFVAQAYSSLKMRAESEAAYRRQIRLVEERLDLIPDDARACVFGAAAFACLQDTEPSAALARRALAIDPDDPMLLYNVACSYAQLHRPDDALDCLESAVDKGYGHKEWIEHDSDFDSIRETPRFKAILETM